MSQLQANLEYLIAKRDTNPTQLEKSTGVKQPTIHRIIKGNTKRPHDDTLTPIAKYFGLTAYVLRYAKIQEADQNPKGEEAQKIAYWVSSEGANDDEDWRHREAGDLPTDWNVEAAPTLRRFKEVPVVGTVEGGPDGYLEELGHPTGHGDGTVEHPAKGRNAYALRVRGESMHPRIRSGEFIIVEPDMPANPGDDVVVICCDGRKMVKQMLYQRDGEVTLGSINNGFKPITLPLAEVEAIHYVAGILPRGAFLRR